MGKYQQQALQNTDNFCEMPIQTQTGTGQHLKVPLHDAHNTPAVSKVASPIPNKDAIEIQPRPIELRGAQQIIQAPQIATVDNLLDATQPHIPGFTIRLCYIYNHQTHRLDFYIDDSFKQRLSDAAAAALRKDLKNDTQTPDLSTTETQNFALGPHLAAHILTEAADFSAYQRDHGVYEEEGKVVQTLVQKGIYPNDANIKPERFLVPAIELLRAGVPIRFEPEQERDIYEHRNPTLYDDFPSERIPAPGVTIYTAHAKQSNPNHATSFGNYYRTARWNVMYEHLGADARDFGITDLRLLFNLCERALGRSPYEFMLKHNQMLDLINIKDLLEKNGINKNAQVTLLNVDSHTDLALDSNNAEYVEAHGIRYPRPKNSYWTTSNIGEWVNVAISQNSSINTLIWQYPAESAVLMATEMAAHQTPKDFFGEVWQSAGDQTWIATPKNAEADFRFRKTEDINNQRYYKPADIENEPVTRSVQAQPGYPLLFIRSPEALEPLANDPNYRIVNVHSVTDAFELSDDEITRIILSYRHHKPEILKSESEFKELKNRVLKRLHQLFSPLKNLDLSDNHVIMTTDLDALGCEVAYARNTKQPLSEDRVTRYLRSIINTQSRPLLHGVCESIGYLNREQFHETHFINTILSLFGRDETSSDQILGHRVDRGYNALLERAHHPFGELLWLTYLSSALRYKNLDEEIKKNPYFYPNKSLNMAVDSPHAKLCYEITQRWGETDSKTIRDFIKDINAQKGNAKGVIAPLMVNRSQASPYPILIDFERSEMLHTSISSKGTPTTKQSRMVWIYKDDLIQAESDKHSWQCRLKEHYAAPYKEVYLHAHLPSSPIFSSGTQYTWQAYAIDTLGNHVALTTSQGHPYLEVAQRHMKEV